MNKKGFSIIEIILVIGASALLLVGVGKVLQTVKQTRLASESRGRSVSLAKNYLETANDMKHDMFACSCATDVCTGSTCTRPSDGQSCTMLPAYTSCWTEYPAGFVGSNKFYFEPSGSGWTLKDLGAGTETVAEYPDFRRELFIENARRDASGNISSTGSQDPNTKLITVKAWREGGSPSAPVSMQAILTAWESI